MEWISLWLAAVTSLLSSDDVRWAGVLGELDTVRAEAFANADPNLLGQVYAPTSAARAVDAAMIGDYQRRGAHVDGANFALLSCKEQRSTADVVSLEVIDQLDQTHVVWDDGTTRALPRDLPTKRVVTLVRTTEGWRINQLRTRRP